MKSTGPTNEDLPDFDDYDDVVESEPLESCPQCGRSYDEIDYDYQCCSKCGWDAENNEPTGNKRRPTNDDYMNGDADILTGQWI